MDVFRFYRVSTWIKNIGMYLIGILSLGITLNPIHVIVILSQLAFLKAWSFSINDYFDAKVRKENNYISSLMKIYPHHLVLFLCVLPLILGFSTFFIFHGNIIFLLLYILIYDLLYEFPPFRLKSYSLYSLIASPLSLVVFLYLYSVLSFTNILPTGTIIFLTIFLFYMTFYEMIHQIAHSKKEMILPKILGVKGGITISKILLILSYVVSLIGIVLDSFIFVITAIFSILKIHKLSKLQKKPEIFEKIRNSWDGFYTVRECSLYILFFLFKYYLL